MIEDGLEAHGRFSFTYDFAKHGGAISAITVGPKSIPPQTIITSGVIRVVTAPVGTNATIALHLVGADDVKAATAITSYTIDAMIVVVPVPQTAATWILTTAHTQLTVTIATAALTAGKFDVHLFGFRSTTT
jgi:predicted outer membrane repeat protein